MEEKKINSGRIVCKSSKENSRQETERNDSEARKFFIRSHAHAHVLEVGPPYIFIFYLDYIGMDVITCFKVLAMMCFIKTAMCLN